MENPASIDEREGRGGGREGRGSSEEREVVGKKPYYLERNLNIGHIHFMKKVSQIQWDLVSFVVITETGGFTALVFYFHTRK